VLLPRLNDTRVILALDADPLGPGPQQIRMGAISLVPGARKPPPKTSCASTSPSRRGRSPARMPITGSSYRHSLFAISPSRSPRSLAPVSTPATYAAGAALREACGRRSQIPSRSCRGDDR
jgi:hypothetical protein